MKKIVLSVGIILGFLAFSCSKNDSYTCNCTYYDSSNIMLNESYDVGEKSSEEDAKSDCDSHASTLETNGATMIDCSVSVSANLDG